MGFGVDTGNNKKIVLDIVAFMPLEFAKQFLRNFYSWNKDLLKKHVPILSLRHKFEKNM